MDPANAREALEEARLDLEEGADMITVKAALPYLDVLRAVHEAFPQAPLAAVLESLTSIKRAGPDAILTYYAHDAASWLRG